MRVHISKIGPGQIVDVRRSENEFCDRYYRTCTVLQGDPPVSDIGDTTPFYIAGLYGGTWRKWNRQFVVQVAGCPLKCWYCYVDNIKADKMESIEYMVEKFLQFRHDVPELNVFHFMGGCPGAHSYLWPSIRRCLDDAGLQDTVFMSDVILLENHFWGARPWESIPNRSLISVCLKGTNFQNFLHNTGSDRFAQAIRELFFYFKNPSVHFSVIEWDPKDEQHIAALFNNEQSKVDWMKVKRYHVVKERMKEKGR